MDKIIAKIGKLGHRLGLAHKEWLMISPKDSTQETQTAALADGVACLQQMYKNADDPIERHDFSLAGRNLRVQHQSYWR